MWELDCKESWAPKNWCFWTVVLEKTLESPFNCKEIQPVHCEGDQPWDFFGGNDAEAETPVLWPPHVKSWLIAKDSDAGRGWGQEEKGTTENEMAGWHHELDGRESEWTVGVDDGQGGLVCWDSWSLNELDMTEWLNWTELNGLVLFPTFFNLSLNLAIRSWWSEPQSDPSLVFSDYIELLSLAAKIIINLTLYLMYINCIYIHWNSNQKWCSDPLARTFKSITWYMIQQRQGN